VIKVHCRPINGLPVGPPMTPSVATQILAAILRGNREPFWHNFWVFLKKGSVVNLQRKKRLGPRWRLCQHSVFNANINSGNGPLLGLTNAPCSLSEPVINVSLGLFNLKGIFYYLSGEGGRGHLHANVPLLLFLHRPTKQDSRRQLSCSK
jgi:hypothetical protein